MICSKYPVRSWLLADPRRADRRENEKEDRNWRDYTGNGDDHSWGDPYDVNDNANTSDGDACVSNQLLNFSPKRSFHNQPFGSFKHPSKRRRSGVFLYSGHVSRSGNRFAIVGDGDTPLKTMVNRRKADQSTEGNPAEGQIFRVKLGLLATNPHGSAFEFTTEQSRRSATIVVMIWTEEKCCRPSSSTTPLS